ncbi:MAG: slipin family protein [Rhodospirillales bacterium]|nr:slipin family protein [Rhodospirillales bacterium]
MGRQGGPRGSKPAGGGGAAPERDRRHRAGRAAPADGDRWAPYRHRWAIGFARHRRRAGRRDPRRLAYTAAVAHRRSERRLAADADRHLRVDLRILHAGPDGSGRVRRHLHPARVLRVSGPADRLDRRCLAAARHRLDGIGGVDRRLRRSRPCRRRCFRPRLRHAGSPRSTGICRRLGSDRPGCGGFDRPFPCSDGPRHARTPAAGRLRNGGDAGSARPSARLAEQGRRGQGSRGDLERARAFNAQPRPECSHHGDRRARPRRRARRSREERSMSLLIGQVWIALAILLLGVLAMSLRVMREYERAVVFLLGRFWKVKGPGLIIILPVIQQMVRIDLRTRVLDVPQQDVISRDNVSVRVNAVVYYRILDAARAVIEVETYEMATSQLAQTTLRSVLGQHELDEMLAEREKLNTDIQQILDEQTAAWGIKVSNVELKRIDLDESMIRAIARQAEAERSRRAKIIDAEGELQAAQRFMQAAEILATQPQALQLRYLTTLQGMSADRSTLIVFPLPLDLLRAFTPKGEHT